jgi:hypothetical protein
MFALGILGEYIGFINQRTLRLPLVVERTVKTSLRASAEMGFSPHRLYFRDHYLR